MERGVDGDEAFVGEGAQGGVEGAGREWSVGCSGFRGDRAEGSLAAADDGEYVSGLEGGGELGGQHPFAGDEEWGGGVVEGAGEEVDAGLAFLPLLADER